MPFDVFCKFKGEKTGDWKGDCPIEAYKDTVEATHLGLPVTVPTDPQTGLPTQTAYYPGNELTVIADKALANMYQAINTNEGFSVTITCVGSDQKSAQKKELWQITHENCTFTNVEMVNPDKYEPGMQNIPARARLTYVAAKSKVENKVGNTVAQWELAKKWG